MSFWGGGLREHQWSMVHSPWSMVHALFMIHGALSILFGCVVGVRCCISGCLLGSSWYQLSVKGPWKSCHLLASTWNACKLWISIRGVHGMLAIHRAMESPGNSWNLWKHTLHGNYGLYIIHGSHGLQSMVSMEFWNPWNAWVGVGDKWIDRVRIKSVLHATI